MARVKNNDGELDEGVSERHDQENNKENITNEPDSSKSYDKSSFESPMDSQINKKIPPYTLKNVTHLAHLTQKKDIEES